MQNKIPTFERCPSRKYFDHWVPNDELIDANDAAIYHNLELSEHGGMVVKEVAISFFPVSRMRALKYKGHPLYDEQRGAYRGYSHSGAGSKYDADGEWMKLGNILPPPDLVDDTGSCLGFSPDADFAWLKHFGFENETYARQALKQFAFIRECEWARDGSIDPASLMKTVAIRKNQAEIHKIKRWIYTEENKQCLKEFEAEIKRQLASSKILCPKNVYMNFKVMRLKFETSETSPGCLEFKEQWDQIREQVISERDMRIKKRDWNAEQEIRAYHIYEIEEEIRSYEYKQKEKVFDEIKNQKISSGEWVVPEGVSIFGTGLCIPLGAVDWDENAPVNILSRQLEELRNQILGE